jgi:hypothetical protein
LQAHLADLSKRALLTEEQWQLKEQIETRKFPVGASEWDRLKIIRKNTRNLEIAETNRRELWDEFLAFLETKNELTDLSFKETDERSFEKVLEAMFFYRSVLSLHSKECFSRNFVLLRDLFAHVNEEHSIIIKARQFLLKEGSEEFLRGIFLRAFPLPQKAAPPGWLDRLFYSL